MTVLLFNLKRCGFYNHILSALLLSMFLVFIFTICSCKKLVEIGPPINSITTEQVFEDSANATAGVLGLYSTMANGFNGFSSGLDTWLGCLLADEAVDFDPSGQTSPFVKNLILSDNTTIASYWNNGYSLIYRANACIEGLENSETISPGTKNQLLSEAKFVRAWSYFLLVNFFGEIPIVSSTEWEKESKKPRVSVDKIYEYILHDLEFSFNNAAQDYPTVGNLPTRVNKFAAAAMLARVYLYKKMWIEAEKYATIVIESPKNYLLEADLDNVFLQASREQVLHLSMDTNAEPFNATYFGIYLLPGYYPKVYLTPELLNSFYPNDLRFKRWLNINNSTGIDLYYPFKFKIGNDQAYPGAPLTECFSLLRLAETYLIRSEAKLNLNDLDGAMADVNVVRNRAELESVSGLSRDEVFDVIMRERQVELFCEWGHRWFDLKRTGKADEVLSAVKPTWKLTASVLPIPYSELQKNPFLTQNPGY